MHHSPATLPCVQVGLICLFFTLMALTLPALDLQRPARRSCAATSVPPTQTAYTDDGIELQTGFACGTWVYDRGHGGQQRGYGVVARAGEPADDGTAKWYINWAAGGRAGGRSTAIQETYLEMAVIANSARCPPTAIGQRVLVVLGNHKNSPGEIVAKVGTCAGGALRCKRWRWRWDRGPCSPCCLLPLTSTAVVPPMVQCGEMWRCTLDAADTRCQSFHSDYLHATSQPAPNAVILAPFTPIVLNTALAADQVPAYLEAMQFDADSPIDLRRKKPDSEAWYDVLTGKQDIGDLADDDLRQLHYMASSGLPACSQQHAQDLRHKQAAPQTPLTSIVPHVGTTVKPTSKSGPLAAEEREALVAGLRRAAAGGWKIVFICARSTACGCPSALEFQHNGDGTAQGHMWKHGHVYLALQLL